MDKTNISKILGENTHNLKKIKQKSQVLSTPKANWLVKTTAVKASNFPGEAGTPREKQSPSVQMVAF